MSENVQNEIRFDPVLFVANILAKVCKNFWVLFMLIFLAFAVTVAISFKLNVFSYTYNMKLTTNFTPLQAGSLALMLESLPTSEIRKGDTIRPLIQSVKYIKIVPEGRNEPDFPDAASLGGVEITTSEKVNGDSLTSYVLRYVNSLDYFQFRISEYHESAQYHLKNIDTFMVLANKFIDKNLNQSIPTATSMVVENGKPENPVWMLADYKKSLLDNQYRLRRHDAFKVLAPFGVPIMKGKIKIGPIFIASLILVFILYFLLEVFIWLYKQSDIYRNSVK